MYQALPGEMREGWKECEAGRLGDEEPASAHRKEKLTIEEYLEMEEKSDEKHEYYKGEIFAMSRPKLDHVRVVMNMVALLMGKLRGSGCEVFATDLRVYVESEELLTYPDLSIVSGESITWKNDDWNLMNPSVIVEVLSKTTMAYDRGTKFELYKGLASLREYILVDSRSVLVEQFCKDGDGRWSWKKYDQLTDSIVVETVGVGLTLGEIYENVRFPKLSE